MIKYLSNNNYGNTSPKIVVDVKVVDTQGLYPSYATPYYIDNSYFYEINENTEMFVKIRFANIKNSDNVKKANFKLTIKSSPIDTVFKLYKLSALFSDFPVTPSSLHGALSNATLVDQVVLPKVSNYDSTQSIHQTISFDISTIVEDYGENTPFIFGITTDNMSNFPLDVYDPNYIVDSGKEVATAVAYHNCGINQLTKYDEVSISNYDHGYVNLRNGEVIHLLNIGRTLSKIMPINVSLSHYWNRMNESSFLPYRLKLNFEYNIYKENGAFVIEDYTGNRKAYQQISTELDSTYYSSLGIGHLNNQGNLYYCIEDGSYIFVSSSSSSSIMIEKYDSFDNYALFLVYSPNSNFELGNVIKTQVIRIMNKNGDEIFYHWDLISNNFSKLTRITNSFGDVVNFTYSNSKLESVSFVNEYKTISFLYDLNSKKVNYSIYNTYSINELISQIVINLYSSEQLSIVREYDGNLNTKKRVSYSYGDSIISNYDVCDKGSVIIARNEYLFQLNYTKVTNYYGEGIYYYFDKYDRVINVLTSKGIVQTINYGEIERGVLKGELGYSIPFYWSANLLQNHSFEYADNQESIMSWNKVGTGDALLSADCLYGNKCLHINTTTDDCLTLEQEIAGTISTSLTLKCQAKGASNGVLKIKIVKYDRNCNNNPVIYSINLNDLSDVWKEYNLVANIGTLLSDEYIKVEIFSSGNNQAFIDDMQLANEKQVIRYNLIENGNLEKATNSLPHDWDFENRKPNDVLATYNDIEHTNIFGLKVMHFSPCNVNRVGKHFAVRKMYRIIDYSGKKSDKYSLGVFAKSYATDNTVFRAFITFEYDYADKNYYFDFAKNCANWQLLIRDIIAEDDYQSITIGIEYDGFRDAYFDAFQLCKDSSFIYYNYDKRGKIVESCDSSGNIELINYNDNMPNTITLKDGSQYEYEYLNNNRLKRITDMFGNSITYSYGDDDLENNVTEITIQKGTEIIERFFEYDVNDNLVVFGDEYSKITEYTYDYLNRVNSVTLPNGCVRRFSYDNLSNLIELTSFLDVSAQNDSHKNNIVYDNTIDCVNSIVSKNGKQYTFVYDSNGRLLSISENGSLVYSFEYFKIINNHNSGLVTSKEYEYSNDIFNFEYDDDGDLIEVRLNSIILYEYEYNELTHISVVKDHIKHVTKYYSYDLNGNLTRIADDSSLTKYCYDSQENVQEKVLYKEDNTRVKTYDYDYEFFDYSRIGFIKRLARNGDELVISDHRGNGEFGLECSDINMDYYYDLQLKSNLFHMSDRNKRIWYKFDSLNANRTGGRIGNKHFDLSDWKSRFNYTKTFYMIFKPYGTPNSNIVNLFKLLDSNNDNKLVCSIDFDSEKRVIYSGKSGYNGISTVTSITLNSWNYLSISIYYQNGYNKLIITLNGENYGPYTINETPFNIDELVISSQEPLRVPYTNESSSGYYYDYSLNVPFYISLIGISNRRFLLAEHNKIFEAWGKYYNNSYIINSKSSSYFNVNHISLDVIPLNENLESIKGLSPVHSLNEVESIDPEGGTYFKYDSSLMRKVFSCFDSDGFEPLVYKKIFEAQGTLAFWFKEEGTLSRNRYLLSIVSNSTLKLSLYIYGSSLYFFNDSITNTFSNQINDSSWHNISFGWNSGYISISVDGVAKGTYTFSLLGSSLLYFGSSQGNKAYALNGYFESIYVADVCQSYYTSFIEAARPKTIGYMQDTLGRVTNKKIVIGNNSFVTNYTYNKTRIISEQFHNDNTINYTYDNIGNITHANSTNNVDQYVYDQLRRLTYHNHNNGGYDETFHYDSNGDITNRDVNQSNIEYVFNYDSNHRLSNVTRNNISYRTFEYANNSFYPNMIRYYNNNGQATNQLGIVWQGNRLMHATVSGLSVLDYEYDDNGIMVYKYKPGERSYFTLEGTNVISIKKILSTSGTDQIVFDYNYDSNDMLVGLTYNNKEYFFVRDILGVIRGIINSNASYIIKYDYTAYGEVTKNIIASSGDDLVVANHNPFMYKGYYYDDALECYYLKTRFYMPSICRFISPDDHSYLDYEDLRGINLYCYCYDNPVMYSDPEGNFVASSFFIAVGIGALAGVLTSYIPDLINNLKYDGFQLSDFLTVNEKNYRQYIGSITSGIISGAVGGLGLNILGTMLFSGAAQLLGEAIAGNVNSIGEGVDIFLKSAFVSGLTYGITKVVGACFGKTQMNTKVLNGSLKNIKVNARINSLTGSYGKALQGMKIGLNSSRDFLRQLAFTNSNRALTESIGGIISLIASIGGL